MNTDTHTFTHTHTRTHICIHLTKNSWNIHKLIIMVIQNLILFLFIINLKMQKKKKNGWESFLHQISQNCVKTQRGEMTFNFFKISE